MEIIPKPNNRTFIGWLNLLEFRQKFNSLKKMSPTEVDLLICLTRHMRFKAIEEFEKQKYKRKKY